MMEEELGGPLDMCLPFQSRLMSHEYDGGEREPHVFGPHHSDRPNRPHRHIHCTDPMVILEHCRCDVGGEGMSQPGAQTCQ